MSALGPCRLCANPLGLDGVVNPVFLRNQLGETHKKSVCCLCCFVACSVPRRGESSAKKKRLKVALLFIWLANVLSCSQRFGGQGLRAAKLGQLRGIAEQ